jgi:hypothetical protein
MVNPHNTMMQFGEVLGMKLNLSVMSTVKCNTPPMMAVVPRSGSSDNKEAVHNR